MLFQVNGHAFVGTQSLRKFRNSQVLHLKLPAGKARFLRFSLVRISATCTLKKILQTLEQKAQTWIEKPSSQGGLEISASLHDFRRASSH